MMTLIGKCLGVAVVRRGSETKGFDETVMGVSTVADDAFGTVTTTEVTISEKILNDKLVAEIKKHTGQEVQVDVSQTAKVWNNNPQLKFYFKALLPAPNFVKTSA